MAILHIAVLVGVGAGVLIITLLLMEEAESKAKEFADSQISSGKGSLGDAYINISPEAFLALRLAFAGTLFFLGTISVNGYLGGLLAFGAFIVPAALLKQMKAKRVRKVEMQLVEGLELMGNALKSGLTLQQAIELLVREFPPPISQEFNLVLAESRLGVELTDGLGNMAKRLDSVIVSILVTGVAITKQCGGDLNEIFQKIAYTIREQANIEGKLKAVTAQGQFQGMILSIMPFALMIILWFVDKAHIETLFGYTIGLAAVGVVVAMVFLAQLWIKKLLTIDV